VEKTFHELYLSILLGGSEGFSDVGEVFNTAVKQRCCEEDKKG
jgi:hypothetical protein